MSSRGQKIQPTLAPQQALGYRTSKKNAQLSQQSITAPLAQKPKPTLISPSYTLSQVDKTQARIAAISTPTPAENPIHILGGIIAKLQVLPKSLESSYSTFSFNHQHARFCVERLITTSYWFTICKSIRSVETQYFSETFIR